MSSAAISPARWTSARVVDNGRLVVEAQPRPRYTLDKLLAQCDPAAELPAEDRQWLDAAPIGNELL